MRVSAILAVSAGLLCASAASAAAPVPQVLHVTVRTVAKKDGKEISQPPRQYWIQGFEKARQEGSKDRLNHDDLLSIFTPSESWQVDLNKKKAVHVLNTKKIVLYIPVVNASGEAKKLVAGLTYGHELKFFTAKHAQKATVKGANGANVDEYSLPVGKGFMSLQVDPKTSKPMQIALHENGKPPIMSLQYLAYETIPYKDSLFKPPAGITVTTVTDAQVRKQHMEIAAKMANYKAKLLSEMQKKNGTF